MKNILKKNKKNTRHSDVPNRYIDVRRLTEHGERITYETHIENISDNIIRRAIDGVTPAEGAK